MPPSPVPQHTSKTAWSLELLLCEFSLYSGVMDKEGSSSSVMDNEGISSGVMDNGCNG